MSLHAKLGARSRCITFRQEAQQRVKRLPIGGQPAGWAPHIGDRTEHRHPVPPPEPLRIVLLGWVARIRTLRQEDRADRDATPGERVQ